MGQYNITIRGAGPHHNPNKADADRMARRFVHELREAGHTIESASITYGGAEALDDGRYDETLPEDRAEAVS